MPKRVSLVVAKGLHSEFCRRYQDFVFQQCTGRAGGQGDLMLCWSVGIGSDGSGGFCLSVSAEFFSEDCNPKDRWIHVPQDEFIGARDRIPVRYEEGGPVRPS